MSPRVCLSLGAWLAGLAVVLGAFGAHLLKDRLPGWYGPVRGSEMLANWETGIRYQMYAALAIVAAGLWAGQAEGRRPTWPAVAQLVGIALFSGFLCAYVLTGERKLASVVPIGGLAMILGWLLFAWQVLWDRSSKAVGRS